MYSEAAEVHHGERALILANSSKRHLPDWTSNAGRPFIRLARDEPEFL